MTDPSPRPRAAAIIVALTWAVGAALALTRPDYAAPALTDPALWLEAAAPLALTLALWTARGRATHFTLIAGLLVLILGLGRLAFFPPGPLTDPTADSWLRLLSLGLGLLAWARAGRGPAEEDEDLLRRQTLALVQFNCSLLVVGHILVFSPSRLFDLSQPSPLILYGLIIGLNWLAWRMGQKYPVYLRLLAGAHLLALLSLFLLWPLFGRKAGPALYVAFTLFTLLIVPLGAVISQIAPGWPGGGLNRPRPLRMRQTAGRFVLVIVFLIGAGFILGRLDLSAPVAEGPTQTLTACRFQLEAPAAWKEIKNAESLQALWSDNKDSYWDDQIHLNPEPPSPDLWEETEKPTSGQTKEIKDLGDSFPFPARLVRIETLDPAPPEARKSSFFLASGDTRNIDWTLIVELPDTGLTLTATDQWREWSADSEKYGQWQRNREEIFLTRAARLAAAYRPDPNPGQPGYDLGPGFLAADPEPGGYRLHCSGHLILSDKKQLIIIGLNTEARERRPQSRKWWPLKVDRYLRTVWHGLRADQRRLIGSRTQTVAGLAGQTRADLRRPLRRPQSPAFTSLTVEWTAFPERGRNYAPLQITYEPNFFEGPVTGPLSHWRTVSESIRPMSGLSSEHTAPD